MNLFKNNLNNIFDKELDWTYFDIYGAKYSTSGASIAFYKNDHPLPAVEKRGQSLSPGTVNKINLAKWKVIIK